MGFGELFLGGHGGLWWCICAAGARVESFIGSLKAIGQASSRT